MARPRILFIRLGAIGDVVRTLPALNLVRTHLPEAFLAWVVEERSQPILRGHPDLDEVIVLERDRLVEELSSPQSVFDALADAIAFGRDLRRSEFTASLDFQGTLKSGLIARAAGAPTRVGYDRRSVKEGNHLLNNRFVQLPSGPMHRVRRNVALLEGIGIRARPEEASVRLPLGEREKSEADRALETVGVPPGPFVFVYPGSSGLQLYKRYPAARLGEAARRLIEAGWVVVAGIGKGEESLALAMREAAGSDLRVLPPTSLLGMAEIIRRARLFIGGDTGPMHIASLQGVPVLALFGPTDPALNAPWGEGHVVLDALAEAPSASLRASDRLDGTLPARRGAPMRRPARASAFDTLEPAAIAEAALRRLSADGDRPAAHAHAPAESAPSRAFARPSATGSH